MIRSRDFCLGGAFRAKTLALDRSGVLVVWVAAWHIMFAAWLFPPCGDRLGELVQILGRVAPTKELPSEIVCPILWTLS